MSQTLPDDFLLADPPVRDRRRYAQHQSQVRKQAGFTADQSLPPATALGARLRELRCGAGLNQAEMAERMGYAQNGRVSDWELGHIMPTLPILYRYARAFGITVSQLLNGVL
jgi:DNA-binding XRE family transcriptional regulator